MILYKGDKDASSLGFYEDVLMSYDSELLTHSKSFTNIFLTVATKEYFEHTNHLLSSIKLSATGWGLVIITFGTDNSLLEKIKLSSFAFLINSPFPDNCISYNDKKAFSANSRIPILKTLSSSCRYNSIVCTDADALVIRDPKDLIAMIRKNNKLIAFRGYPKHLYSLQNGFMPFKSGTIVCRPEKSNCLDPLLDFYSYKVLSNWNLWSADQLGLSILVAEFRFKDLIFIGKRKFNDWDFLPYTYVWHAKGNTKNSFSWLLAQKTILLFSSKSLRCSKPIRKFLKNLILFFVFIIFVFEKKIFSVIREILVTQFRILSNNNF